MLMVSQTYTTVGSGNGLGLLERKPLPEPMLTKFFDAIWRH